jgi:methanogenic corrinoid protein MtbC1
MTYNLNEIKRVIDLIKSSKECEDIKIIVGGYGFNNSKEIWKDVGSDYFAPGAEKAVSIITSLR